MTVCRMEETQAESLNINLEPKDIQTEQGGGWRLLTTNMTPPWGDWMCTHACGVERAGWLPPWQTGCWVYSRPSQSSR